MGARPSPVALPLPAGGHGDRGPPGPCPRAVVRGGGGSEAAVCGAAGEGSGVAGRLGWMFLGTDKRARPSPIWAQETPVQKERVGLSLVGAISSSSPTKIPPRFAWWTKSIR